MRTRRFILGTVALVGLGLTCGAHAQDDAVATGAPKPGAWIEPFTAGNYAHAQELLQQELVESPKDPFLNYNLACTLAMQHQIDEAAERLLDAITFGFVDFARMSRDANLAPLHAHKTYQLIQHGWRELLDARGDADFDAAREALGQRYTFERSTRLRLSFASAAAPDSFESAKQEIERVAQWADEHVFPPEWHSDEQNRPPPWVLVVLPTPADFARLGGVPGIGGYYDKDHKRLLTQDIGPTLRHEFFHVLHWRHMDSLAQDHAYWLMEGLASLLEDVDLDDEGNYVLAPSWRTNIARRLAKMGRLTPLAQLLSMPRSRFMGSRSRANYAQARAICLYLYDTDKLKPWYANYVEFFDEDQTGELAFETVFNTPLAQIQRDYRQWLIDLPQVADIDRPAEASLGVAVSPGSGDGPRVSEFVSRSSGLFPTDEKLRRRDVILALDGRPTPTLDDLQRVLGAFAPGQVVTLTVRRSSRTLDVPLKLTTRNRGG